MHPTRHDIPAVDPTQLERASLVRPTLDELSRDDSDDAVDAFTERLLLSLAGLLSVAGLLLIVVSSAQ